MAHRKENRTSKNGRLTVSLPEDVVKMLDGVGDSLKEKTGLPLSYAQIIFALVHHYHKGTN